MGVHPRPAPAELVRPRQPTSHPTPQVPGAQEQKHAGTRPGRNPGTQQPGADHRGGGLFVPGDVQRPTAHRQREAKAVPHRVYGVCGEAL